MVKEWEATYTEFTRDTAQYPKDVEMEYLMIGLANEVGEVLGKYKKHLRGDTMVVQDFRDALIDELGDVMWYIVQGCYGLDIDLETVIKENIKKLETRYPNGFEMIRSENRNEGDI